VLLGGTSSVVAREGYLNLAVGKFGLRALAHVLARELGSQGIHVVHCLVDAEIANGDAEGLTLNAQHLAGQTVETSKAAIPLLIRYARLGPGGSRASL